MNLEDLDLEALAEAHGTPFYLYDMDAARSHVGRLRQALPEAAEVLYAMKANPNPGVLSAFQSAVDGLDLSSAGELAVAQRLGYPSSAMSFAGPGKSHSELRAAVSAEIGLISVESAAELSRLIEVCKDLGRTQSITLRINPQQIPKPFMMKMGGRPSQFGIPEEDIDEPLRAAIDASEIDLKGFHIYAGTQCLDADAVVENIEQTLALTEALSDKYDLSPEVINLGGGFGVAYFPGQVSLDHEVVARRVAETLEAASSRSRFRGAKFILELGRYLIGMFGIYVARVIEVKETRGKRFAIMDGGMHHCFAATGNFGQLVKKNYPIDNASGGAREVTPHELVGPLCTPLDSMARGVKVAQAEAGDLMLFRHTGAYAYTASPLLFLGHDTPPELVRVDGEVSVSRTRRAAVDFLG